MLHRKYFSANRLSFRDCLIRLLSGTSVDSRLGWDHRVRIEGKHGDYRLLTAVLYMKGVIPMK